MTTVTKHFIEYRSPGTFVDEISSVEVPENGLTIENGVTKAKEIFERHGAKPYGFHFVTKVHEETELNGKILTSDPDITKSGCHFLNGEVWELKDVPNMKEFDILRSNMRSNNIPAVVVTRNSYRHTGALEPKDVVLHGIEIVARGEDYYTRNT